MPVDDEKVNCDAAMDVYMQCVEAMKKQGGLSMHSGECEEEKQVYRTCVKAEKAAKSAPAAGK
jgi:hypothetical protein